MSKHWEERVSDRDAGREPCPDRIIEDLGGAFGMGGIGGFLWHFVKGARNAPQGDRFATALYSARSRAPILGGNFAVWGGTFSTFDCSLQYIRRKDDHWNAIASGFMTGGVLAARGGWKAAGRNAAIGGVLLAIIEGVAGLLMRTTSRTPREMALEQIEQEKQMQDFKKRSDSGELSSMESWVQSAQAATGLAMPAPAS
jgi:import inner membrane translocase subunit TIM17